MDISFLGCEGEHSDLLAIDDLLDFSNDDIGGPIDSSELSTPSAELPTLSSHASSPKDSKKSPHPAACVFDSNELCIPCDDLAELEWLSNFVEESFSSGDHMPASFCSGTIGKSASEDSAAAHGDSQKDAYRTTSPVSVLKSGRTHVREKALNVNTGGADASVPARARSKRCRTAVCFWNSRILSAEASESLLECSSTTSTITSDSDIITTYYDHDDDDYDAKDDNEEDEDDEDEDEDIDDEDIDDDIDDGGHTRRYHTQKRASDSSLNKFNKAFHSFSYSKPKKLKVQAADGGGQQQAVRKCLHCAAQKTPQWRAGPMGPKTLCNACGVRYKSGRLCAEYRPAASPTFIESMHSNSHRKVLEMRRQRGDVVSASGIPRQ